MHIQIHVQRHTCTYKYTVLYGPNKYVVCNALRTHIHCYGQISNITSKQTDRKTHTDTDTAIHAKKYIATGTHT